MGLFDKLRGAVTGNDSTTSSTTVGTAPSAASTPASTTASASAGELLDLSKGDDVLDLSKDTGGVFTLICQWGSKDYDLYALVEYTDDRVETVSCFGTQDHPNKKRPGYPEGWTTRTDDGAVEHVSGDQTAYAGGTPQEVIKIRLNDTIRTVVPVVYSAQNSGVGSFRRYGVSTYVISGDHDTVPSGGVEMVRVNAIDASRDENVYTFVPAVIHNDASGAHLEPVELYSRRGSENRPAVRKGQVSMDAGPRNVFK